MNAKVWLITFGVIAAAIVGGAGFYAFSSYGKYSEQLSGWDSRVGKIETLERKSPYPNKDNAEALAEKVESYDVSVQQLYESLNAFQRPLNTSLANTEFQQLVKNRVEQFRTFATEGGLGIESETEFQLGFDIYASTLPQPGLVPILDYELEAIDHLLRELVNAGVETLSTFERDPIPGEVGGPADHESGVVHKYPIRLRFSGTHESFQKFINSVANDSQFFYIVRVLKVQNSQREGPIKLSAVGPGGFPQFVNPLTQEMASPEMLAEWGYDNTDASLTTVATAAQQEGFVSSEQDARVLMGQEKLNVFMVVDITRFLSPEEVAEMNGESESKEKGERR